MRLSSCSFVAAILRWVWNMGSRKIAAATARKNSMRMTLWMPRDRSNPHCAVDSKAMVTSPMKTSDILRLIRPIGSKS